MKILQWIKYEYRRRPVAEQIVFLFWITILLFGYAVLANNAIARVTCAFLIAYIVYLSRKAIWTVMTIIWGIWSEAYHNWEKDNVNRSQ